MLKQEVKVTIAKELYQKWDFIEKIAIGIAKYEASDGEHYEPFLGHKGKFENNPRADSLNKIHIANIGGLLSDNWKSQKGYKRTSNHFVVYAEHWNLDDCFHILDVVTPNAHQRIDSLITALIDKAEAFNAFTKTQIEQMPNYTANSLNEHN